MKKCNVIKILVLAVFALAFASCYTPSPLYGAWSDNLGNKLQFNDDNTYNATIVVDGENKSYSGTYKVAENVMTLSGEKTIVTEWDIRGSILYLQWPEVSDVGTEVRMLSLYHN